MPWSLLPARTVALQDAMGFFQSTSCSAEEQEFMGRLQDRILSKVFVNSS